MAEEKAKAVNGPGRGARRGMPRPKIKNPGRLLRRTLGYVFRYYPVYMIVVAVCIVVSVLANVQGTMFTRTLIDSYITPLREAAEAGRAVNYSPLLHAMARVAVFYLIGIGAALTQSVVMTYVNQGTLNRLRNELFEHMESLPIRYFDTHAHGDIMSIYTNDIDTLRQMISQSLPQLLNSGITIVSIVSMMLVLSIPLTVLSIVMVALMLAASMSATKISGRNFVEQQKSLGSLNGFIEETMTGQKIVKVFNHEEESIREFDRRNEELYRSSYQANAYSNILGPINTQLGNTSYVLCALVGGMLALNRYAGFTVGALASFLTFNKSFSMPINQVSMQINSIFMALAGAERVFRLLDETPETDDGYVTLVNVRGAGNTEETNEHTGFWSWKHYHKATDTTSYVPLAGDVTFNDVDFGYTDGEPVLHDIQLHAEPGQKIALVGSTGAGKTTITNLINRFYDIQDGKIRYDNININKISKKDLRRSLGMVLQDTHLFTGTVADNIRYGKLDATDEEVVAAAKLANADSFIRRLPQGYETELHGDGSNLSQGQRQLLAIARAAIADPPVLILDEATSSIDTRTEKIVQNGMDRLMHGRTSFVIAHRLSTIRNSDVIVVLENGRIVEKGSHDELMEKKGRYYQLYTGKRPELAG
ncbi:ABC transporter ATP-binding protein [Lachnoclostridium sp. Marseille-P6806]|uniref:ABC transporter ATP-binding protein n=1 Tax=Lachnoclostridium sp. Marseille-P6806 TaxID=2364793 RepID=UPI0010307B4E|nr:ABC transporter ATP-binding protein [Lachnoclostridium sp. Marseille-P6806]